MKARTSNIVSSILYLQVGDEEFYGPYTSHQGLDSRIRAYLRHVDFHVRNGLWEKPVILQCEVGKPEVYCSL